MTEILRGETRLDRILLVNQSSGNPILIETLTSIKVEIYQNLVTHAIYTYPCSELRLGDSSNEILIEIKSDISQKFLDGFVRCKITLSQPSLSFPANPYAVDCIEYVICNVVEVATVDTVLVYSRTLKTALDAITLLLSSEELLSSETKLASGRA